MGLILYAMLLGHLAGYKDEYLNIATTFATTVMIKLVVNRSGAKDHATMIGIGGGFVTLKQVFVLLEKVTAKGFDGKGVAGTTDTGNGLVGDFFIKVMELIKNKE